MPVPSMPLFPNADAPTAAGDESLAIDGQYGATIGDGTYTIEAVLGQGGMGVVYAGVHNWTGRAVAIKVLRREVSDVVDVSRMLQEARAATAVAHPNVVEVLDMGRDPDGRVYLVFERLAGETLADMLDRVGVLTPDEAAEVLLPVLDALAFAHDLGIVHRDVKPENIFLAQDASGSVRPKLLDFGLAKMHQAGTHTTQTGVISGTPAYMSPERAMGKRETGAETDVWSMGVVLFECLTNRLPFNADHAMGILLAVVSEPVPSLRGSPDVPRAVADVLDAALSRDALMRLPDGAAFRDALALALGRELRSSFVRIARTPSVTTIGHAVGVPRRVSNDMLRTRSPASLADVFAASSSAALSTPRESRARAVTFAAGALVLGAIALFFLRSPGVSSARETAAPAAVAAERAPEVVTPSPTVPPVPIPVPEVPPPAAVAEVERPQTMRARGSVSPRTSRPTPRGRPARGTNGVFILD